MLKCYISRDGEDISMYKTSKIKNPDHLVREKYAW